MLYNKCYINIGKRSHEKSHSNKTSDTLDCEISNSVEICI